MIPVGRLCSCFGCEKVAITKGLCDMHRKRLARHAHLEQTRPADWGKREAHPLYRYWCQLRRANGGELGVWYDDFWKFVSAVGDRPTGDPMLIRLDTAKPWDADNVMWCESKAGPALNEFERGQRRKNASYQREYAAKRRAADPFHEAAITLQRFHGLSFDDYEKLLESQGGGCAICGRGEPRRDGKTGNTYRLAVDHCHSTNELRGLLCSMCNHAIGYLDDSPFLLQRAIAYLADPPARKFGMARSGLTRARIRQRPVSPYASPPPGDPA